MERAVFDMGEGDVAREASVDAPVGSASLRVPLVDV